MIRAILFDAAGTLFFLTKTVGDHYAYVGREVGLNLDAQKLNKNEMKLATTLVQEMATTLAEIDTEDNYYNALRTLIDSKIKGREIAEFEVEEVPRLDIMSALKKSLQASNRKPMVKATTAAAKKKPLTLVKDEAKAKTVKRRKAS